MKNRLKGVLIYETVYGFGKSSQEMDALYHQSSLKLGISDSVSMVMYTIYDRGNECKLSDIYKSTGISKQTINSAIRQLETKGILYLEMYNGKQKKVMLTEKGKCFVEQTAARLFQAESDTFNDWTEEEISTYIGLMEKHEACFRRQIEKM